MIKANVRKNEIKADTFPFDNAVKTADENMLKPEKRKLNTNIINPFTAILYTSSLVSVKKRTRFPPLINAKIKMNKELIIIKEIHILYIFLNLQ